MGEEKLVGRMTLSHCPAVSVTVSSGRAKLFWSQSGPALLVQVLPPTTGCGFFLCCTRGKWDPCLPCNGIQVGISGVGCGN